MAVPDRPNSVRSRADRSRSKAASMTLDEAQLIEAQLQQGTLDLTLPGTAEIVGEAHRVRLKATLWGADRDDSRRKQVRGTVVVVCAFLVVTIFGLVACLAVRP